MAGRPLDQTPAIKGASRAHIECDVNVDSLAYWNDPQGTRDQSFQSPFAVQVSATCKPGFDFLLLLFVLVPLSAKCYPLKPYRLAI